jgi:hypothetical protein
MISELIDEPKGLYLHRQIEFATKFEKPNYKSLLEIISNSIQEGEMSEFAIGWKQTVSLEANTFEDMVPIFTQDFKNYCKHLEKTRLLPFNFF